MWELFKEKLKNADGFEFLMTVMMFGVGVFGILAMISSIISDIIKFCVV